jgi:Protein of unknown function (DUF1360)
MLITSLVVAALAVARLTRLLVSDSITVFIRQWVIRTWGADSLPAKLFHCSWCMSIWIALPVMPVATLFPNRWVIAILAIPAASYLAGFLANREDGN